MITAVLNVQLQKATDSYELADDDLYSSTHMAKVGVKGLMYHMGQSSPVYIYCRHFNELLPSVQICHNLWQILDINMHTTNHDQIKAKQLHSRTVLRRVDYELGGHVHWVQ